MILELKTNTRAMFDLYWVIYTSVIGMILQTTILYEVNIELHDLFHLVLAMKYEPHYDLQVSCETLSIVQKLNIVQGKTISFFMQG